MAPMDGVTVAAPSRNHAGLRSGKVINGAEAARFSGDPKWAMGKLAFKGNINMPELNQFFEPHV